MADHRRHFAVEKLSPQGQAVVREGVEANWTLERIVEEVRTATGESLAMSSLHRWMQAERVRARIEHRQQAVGAALAMISADPDGRLARMINLALEERLLESEEALGALAFDQQVALWQQMAKVSLQHQRIQIADREAKAAMVKAIAAEKSSEAAMTQADVAMRKVELLEKKMQAVAKTVEEARGQAKDGKVPVETLQRVLDEVYGLQRHAAAVVAEDAHA